MRASLALGLLLTSLTACASIESVPSAGADMNGLWFTPMVLVFDRAEEVIGPFESVGTVAGSGSEAAPLEEIVDELRARAETLGADAIVLSRILRSADGECCQLTVDAEAIRWSDRR